MYLVYSGWFDAIRKVYFRKLFGAGKLNKGMRILDYGCGPGDLLLVAKELGYNIDGVDAHARSVEIARSRGLNVSLGDANSLEYPDETFDAIILQSVIEHIENPVSVLAVLRRYIRPGGVLIVSAPTPGSHFWDDPTHIRPYTPTSFKIVGDLLELDVEYLGYVFSFLLGLRLTNSLFYKLLNTIPVPLGSNLIAIYRKK